MAFKLISSNGVDRPVFVCDVCGLWITDLWNDKASGSRGADMVLTNVVIHHAACPTVEPTHMALIDFVKMLSVRNMIGDVSSDGVTTKLTVSLPTDAEFGS